MKWMSKLRATRVLVGAFGVLFVVSFISGMEFGRINSPDYSDATATLQFLVNNLKVDEANDADVKVHVVAGPYNYDYSLSADSVKRTPLDQALLLRMRTPKRWRYFEQRHIEELLGMSMPAALVAALSKIASKTPTAKAKVSEVILAGGVVAVVGMLATGGVVGYLLTYSDQEDYNNPDFQKVLTEKENWQHYALSIKECRVKFSQVCTNWGVNK